MIAPMGSLEPCKTCGLHVCACDPPNGLTDDEKYLAVIDRMIDLEVIIRQARALITPDGTCWADGGMHRPASCLLCHVRAVLDDQPLPTEAAP